MALRPLPETRDVLRRLSRDHERDLTAELLRQGELVEDLVPNLVGLSLALVQQGLTFTIAATAQEVRLLDAIQYALGGPCVDAALQDRTVLGGDSEEGLLDEQRWAHFARAGAAHGVMSTLSLPVHRAGRVVGGVNLYAATPNAFAGKVQQVAAAVGAWAPGAVHNADLSFSTMDTARQAPQVLANLDVMNQATGVVMAAHGVDQARARGIISDAARRADHDELTVARELIGPFLPDDPSR